jgi:hypothetical protein
MNIPTDIMILLFLALEDRATVRTDSSANVRFTKESDARECHSFYFAHRETPLSLENLKRKTSGLGRAQ